MDDFRETCKTKLRQGNFFSEEDHTNFSYTGFGMSIIDGLPVYVKKRLQSHELTAFLRDPPPREDWRVYNRIIPGQSRPSAKLNIVGRGVLRLIEVCTDSMGLLVIDHDAFFGLFEEPVSIDYGAAWLIMHKYDGFHHFPGDGRHTFYFGWSLYSLIWTFDFQSLSTYVCCLDRHGHNDVDGILEVFKTHGRHLFSPAFVGYCMGLSLATEFDARGSMLDLWSMKKIEFATGYSSAGRPVQENFGLDLLTRWLRETGQTLINTSVRKRTMRSVRAMLDQAETMTIARAASSTNDEEAREAIEESTQNLMAALPMFRSRLHAYDEYMDYMTLRVERLSTVLFALLTHKDAETSIEQAHASRELAEAAKRDSSAMKAIAVMTMAFLPATFFAALFAIPTLDWKSETGSVVQSNHWIYWAFTLPATVLVFMLWLLLDNRHWVVRQCTERLGASRKVKLEKVV